MKIMKFQGVIPALITPVDENGKLNKTALKELLEAQIKEGADGFYVGGATGEGVILDADVLRDLMKESVSIVNHRVPVIIHIARMNNHEMIEMAKYAEKVGADAVSAIPPIFYKYDEDSIYAYYKRLADSVGLPIVIYNNPNTGVTFTDDLLYRLFGTIPSITAIKWTNYDFTAVLRLKDRFPDACVINGPDEMLLMGLAAGCDACIGTTYNFQLTRIKNIYNAFRAGNIEEARREQTVACKIINVMLKNNVLKCTRLILARRGFATGIPMFPMLPYASKAEEDKILAELKAAGLEI